MGYCDWPGHLIANLRSHQEVYPITLSDIRGMGAVPYHVWSAIGAFMGAIYDPSTLAMNSRLHQGFRLRTR